MKHLIILFSFIIGCGSNVVQFPESKDSPGVVQPNPGTSNNNCTDNQKKNLYLECFDLSSKDPSYCHFKRAGCMKDCAAKCSALITLNDCSCQDYYSCYTVCELGCLNGECE